MPDMWKLFVIYSLLRTLDIHWRFLHHGHLTSLYLSISVSVSPHLCLFGLPFFLLKKIFEFSFYLFNAGDWIQDLACATSCLPLTYTVNPLKKYFFKHTLRNSLNKASFNVNCVWEFYSV
jgi:hypothetical protein